MRRMLAVFGGGRGRHVRVDEDPSFLRARRIAAHPMAEVLRCEADHDLSRGPVGATVVSLTVALGDEHAADLDRDVGDAGGDRDRAIAYAARELTKQGEPQAVIEALLTHYVETPGDLGRALGLDPACEISTEVRKRIADAFGLVEPPLPKWVREGDEVERDERGRGERGLVRRVDAHGVTLDRYQEPVPPGVFVVMGWKPVTR